jgi:hypothetical protein
MHMCHTAACCLHRIVAVPGAARIELFHSSIMCKQMNDIAAQLMSMLMRRMQQRSSALHKLVACHAALCLAHAVQHHWLPIVITVCPLQHTELLFGCALDNDSVLVHVCRTYDS